MRSLTLKTRYSVGRISAPGKHLQMRGHFTLFFYKDEKHYIF